MYTNLTKEQLIAELVNRDSVITQLQQEILELKRGYIYVVQFDGDKEKGIFKAGKTGKNIENRFAQYRSNFSEKFGELNIVRVAAVNDSLSAEQMMHELIRSYGVVSVNDPERNKKSLTKSEWYIDSEMELIENAFNETVGKY